MPAFLVLTELPTYNSMKQKHSVASRQHGTCWRIHKSLTRMQNLSMQYKFMKTSSVVLCFSQHLSSKSRMCHWNNRLFWWFEPQVFTSLNLLHSQLHSLYVTLFGVIWNHLVLGHYYINLVFSERFCLLHFMKLGFYTGYGTRKKAYKYTF